MGKVHRYNVNFTESAYAELQAMANRTGRSVAQVLRDAVAKIVWWDDQQQKGNRILVERDGRVREVEWL